MKIEDILNTFEFVEKEDLQVWPDSCIEQLDERNVQKIMDYLSRGSVSGEELFVLDLPAFLYPVERFKTLWEALSKEQGKYFARNISDEEITPSDEFIRLEKKIGGKASAAK